MSVTHFLSFFVNVFREIFETQLGSIGIIMRLIEVGCCGCYSVFIIHGLWFVSIYHYWNDHKAKLDTDNRLCFTDREMLYDMSGTTTAFMEIEVLVYFTFIVTIVFYVARSRCMKSGIDNSEQFEGVYMSYLVNKIIQSMVFNGKKYNRKFNA
jgi:hypothetical protein